MQRCIRLALHGAGRVAPNPLVGAVLVHEDRIIGEGWHRQYGQAHAEVNCIRDAMKNGNAAFIPQSTLYVSLEPCAHHGKTPPCTDLIIANRVPNVVIGCRDPFPAVNGKGIEKLEAAGVKVITAVLEQECRELNRRFLTFHEKHRPYIVLKWAETADGFIAPASQSAGSTRLHISNHYSNRLVHRWRSEEAAILVGARTALLDDPELTNRYWTGPSPVRLLLDPGLKLPVTARLYDGKQQTIIFNSIKEGEEGSVVFYRISPEKNTITQLLEALYQLQLTSVLVEGGATLLRSFIEAGAWDEARIIQNQALRIGEGLAAPVLTSGRESSSMILGDDVVRIFKRI